MSSQGVEHSSLLPLRICFHEDGRGCLSSHIKDREAVEKTGGRLNTGQKKITLMEGVAME